MRLTGPVKRVACALLAATIGTLAPGLTPLAAAQPAGGSEQPEMPGGSWRPPQVNPDLRPDGNDGQPLKTYKRGTKCISSQDDLKKDVQITAKPWAQQYLRLEEVHELMRNTTPGVGLSAEDGSPITVGVIDTGVRGTHKWLPNVHEGGDYVSLDTGKKPGLEDCDGHGTLVAGIIAANTPEGIGFKGVAPDAQIFSVRQSSANYKIEKKDDPPEQPKDEQPSGSESPPPEEGGDKPPDSESQLPPEGDSQPSGAGTAAAQQGEKKGSAGSIESLAHAIVFTASNRAIDVMNISIDNCQAVGNARGPKMAALHAAINYAVDVEDVVVVASAGNIDKKAGCIQNNRAKPRTIVAPPWFAEDVLSVAAIKRNGGVAKFSMHGPWVGVAAPGTHILSLDPAPGSNGLANLMIKDKKQSRVRGTSFAAPYVAGLAALVRAKYPDLNAHQVMNRIKATAQHPAAPGGRNQYVGYGVINPMAALTTNPAALKDLGQQRSDVGTSPADLPPPANRDWTPVAVALGGAGGALVALLITLFTVHTIRRNRTERV